MPKRAGRKSKAQTPAPPSERIVGSKKNPKGSAASEKSASKIKLNEKTIEALKNKLSEFKKEHPNKKNITLNDLKAVYRRGAGAYSKSHRPTITGGVPNTRNAWAMARVNKFLKKAGGEKVKAAYVQDDDLMAKGGEVSGINYTILKGKDNDQRIVRFQKGIYRGNEIDEHEAIFEKSWGRIGGQGWAHINEFGFTHPTIREAVKNYLWKKTKKLEGGGITLLAPNGKPSNLTPEQYKLVRTPQFKAWFGDWENDPQNASKVVDENGEPLVVYRGVKGLYDYKKSGNQFFTPDLSYAKAFGYNIISCFLNIRDLLDLEYYNKIIKEKRYETPFGDRLFQMGDAFLNENKNYWYENQVSVLEFDDAELAGEIFDRLKEVDGIVGVEAGFREIKSYLVWNPNQIKLADGSNTTFDVDNDDARYEDGGEVSIQKHDIGHGEHYIRIKYGANEIRLTNYDLYIPNEIIDKINEPKEKIYQFNSVYVSPSDRGQGIASKLLKATIDYAKEKEIFLVTLIHSQSNSTLDDAELMNWLSRYGFSILYTENKELTYACFDGTKERKSMKIGYKEGGRVGGFEDLEDEWLSKKIEIFLDKAKPYKFYFVDPKTNSLIVGFDEYVTQEHLEKVYLEATSSKEFFHGNSVEAKFNKETGDTIFKIRLRNKVIYHHGGSIDELNEDSIVYKIVNGEVGSINPNERYILSHEREIKFRWKEQLNNKMKPDGLWYSFGSEWADWVAREMPKWGNDYDYLHKIDVTNRVLRLDTIEKCLEFTEKFGELNRIGDYLINWYNVSKVYSGIEVTEPRKFWATQFHNTDKNTNDYRKLWWLYGWDVGSGCIWREDGIESIELVYGNEYAKGGEVDEKLIKERWAKKKDSLMNMADNIRSLRTNLRKDLKSDNDKDRLTALAISLMDKTAERVGNDESEANGHLGITGLSKRNVKVEGNTITLKYVGKSGVKHEKQFSDEGIANALKDAIANSQSKYVFETSDRFRIKNDRVNRYLSEYDISAKDLRGYSANQWIVSKLREVKDKEILGDEAKRKKKFNEIVKSVAEKVGHGAPTLKKHYMLPSLEREWVNHGRIVDLSNIKRAFEDGGVISYANGGSPRIRTFEANDIKKYILEKNEKGESASWSNSNFQYVARPDGILLSYDLNSNKYKFYNDLDSFIRALYRFQNRGYKRGGDVGIGSINKGSSVVNNIDYDHLDESQDLPNDGEGVFKKGGSLKRLAPGFYEGVYKGLKFQITQQEINAYGGKPMWYYEIYNENLGYYGKANDLYFTKAETLDAVKQDIDSRSNEMKKGGEIKFNDTIIYHEEKGNFFVPKNTIYAWLYDDPNAGKKLNDGEYDFVLFPPGGGIGLLGQKGYVPPLLKVWRKSYQDKTKGSDKLIGIVKAWYDEENKKLYIDMMTTKRQWRRKGVNTHIIKELREMFNLDKDQIVFDKPTDEGKKFMESGKYSKGGEVDRGQANYGEPNVTIDKIPLIHETIKEYAKSILKEGFKKSSNKNITLGVYTIPLVWKESPFDNSSRSGIELKVKLKKGSKIFWTNTNRPMDFYYGVGNKYFNSLFKKLGGKHDDSTRLKFLRNFEKWLDDNGYCGVQQGGEIVITNLSCIDIVEKYTRDKLAKGGELSDENKKEIYKKWKSLVNMSKSELEKFYNSEEGKVAGLTPSQAKSQGIDSGRESARWIMKMKSTSVKDWTPTMWKWAKKQISFVSRMSGNKGPLYDEKGNKTRKHTSLLIWGHNPKKKAEGGEIESQLNNLNMNEVTYNQLPAINDLGVGKKFVLKEHFYGNEGGKPSHRGCRYLIVENMGDAQMADCLKLKVHHAFGGGGVTTRGIITRPIKNIMNKGREMGESLASGVEKAFKKGGELDPDKKEVKEYFEHKSGAAGGLLVGKRHSEGGIQAINKSTGQPLEMEGGEVVITRDAVSDSTLHDFNGKQMTNREILSAINESGGGVKFADGGDVSCKCSGKEYKFGGRTYKDYELFNKINNGYGSTSAIKKGMEVEDKEHGETFKLLKNGEITYEQFLKKLVVDHLSENPKYYDK
jgi:GNAT superfamily N-acetyltransferase